MLRTFHACTFEYDDAEAAVEEILDQINLDDLDKNTVGIFACPIESLEADVIKALSDSLPFDTIGCTTIMTDLCGESSEDQISLFILTADDVEFACGMSDSLGENVETAISNMYDSTVSKLVEKPVMGLSFTPLIYLIGADRQLRALNAAADGLPIFGTVALHYTDKVEIPYTFLNGEHFEDRMAILLIGGAFEPHFSFASIPENRYLKQKAIITASEDNLLKEVNGVNAMEYLQELGITDGSKVESIPSVPLSVDVGDGAMPVARSIMGSTDEGYMICGGDMPVDAALGVGFVDATDVQETAEQVSQSILDSGAENGAIIVSCLSRLMALGIDMELEVDIFKTALEDKIPYLLLYSGGELYPEIIDGKIYNKAHNVSILSCTF